MKKDKNQLRRNEHPSGQNKRNHHDPSGPSKRQPFDPADENRETKKGGSSSTDSSNRNNGRDQDPIQTSDTPANEKTGRGYQDMNKRNLEQDFHKNLDEDKINHYDSESGFDEFDEYADEVDEEGNDQEYNSRYNDDRNEENEIEELHTDTEISQELAENEKPEGQEGRKGKRKRLSKTAIAKKNGPIAQTEAEADNNPVNKARVNKAARHTTEKKHPTPPARNPNKGSKPSAQNKNKRGK